MKPLTDGELRVLDQMVAKGETIKLWLVWPDSITPLRAITALRAEPGELLYVGSDTDPMVAFPISNIRYPVFTNYWHAYAFYLHRGEK